MTMHLARGLSTINTKKPKQKKLTQAQLDKLQIEWRKFNKDMRRKNMHSLQWNTFEDYLDYVQGKYKPKRKEEFVPLQTTKSFQRETQNIPSLSNGIDGWAPKKESIKYTGTLIKGIATMHKSNAVPIINKEQAIEVSNMRRN